jgi:hypothetical protein
MMYVRLPLSLRNIDVCCSNAASTAARKPSGWVLAMTPAWLRCLAGGTGSKFHLRLRIGNKCYMSVNPACACDPRVRAISECLLDDIRASCCFNGKIARWSTAELWIQQRIGWIAKSRPSSNNHSFLVPQIEAATGQLEHPIS